MSRALLLALALCAAAVRAAEPALGEAAARTLPVADAHFHVQEWMDLAELLQRMDRNGIRYAGGAGALGGPERNAQVAAALGKRYIRPGGQGPWLNLKRQGGAAVLENAEAPGFRGALAAIERQLKDGALVVGEIHVNTASSAVNPFVRHKVRADAPTLRAMLELAARYKRPLAVHAQFDPDTVEQLAALAASNREARLILAHCGSTATAEEVRAFFEKHANVSCDLSFRSPPLTAGRISDRTVFEAGRGIRGGWKQLIEDYPDRFMVGTDAAENWASWEETLRQIRLGLLAYLSPATAERLAYGNARALFGLE